MRFWPLRGRPARVSPSPEEVLVTEELLRRSVEDVFVIRDRRVQSGILAFLGDLRAEPSRALDVLVARLRPFGYTPFLTAEGDAVVLQVWPLAATVERPRFALNLILFLLTCASTLVAGAFFSGSPTFDALSRSAGVGRFFTGAPFAFTLLAILGVHEFGHYFTARRYGASVSLPYFIPAPPPIFLFGTLGAIIRMRSPAKDRNALFDIAAAGPLAGLAVAIPAIVLGLSWSTIVPAPAGGYVGFGQSLLMRFLVQLRFGAIPPDMILYTHPMADAAWAGFLVTALNLFPVGQLDGGRIAYALFGRRHRMVGGITLGLLTLMGLLTGSLNWFVWAALIFFLVGVHHAPPLDDLTPLSLGRRVVGFACLVLLVLLIPPVPIEIG